MKKILAVIVIFLFISTFVFTGLVINKNKPLKEITCSGSLTFFKKNSEMRLASRLDYSNNRGILYLNGGVYNDKNQIGIVSRTINFKSSNENNLFTWVSTDIKKGMEDDLDTELVNKWFPDFYRVVGARTEIKILNFNFDSILISNNLSPLYICSRQ